MAHLGLRELWLNYSAVAMSLNIIIETVDQSRQNGYQTVPFSVYIPNLVFLFNLE